MRHCLILVSTSIVCCNSCNFSRVCSPCCYAFHIPYEEFFCPPLLYIKSVKNEVDLSFVKFGEMKPNRIVKYTTRRSLAIRVQFDSVLLRAAQRQNPCNKLATGRQRQQHRH